MLSFWERLASEYFVKCQNGKSGYYADYGCSTYIPCRYCGPDCSKRLYSDCSGACETVTAICGGEKEIAQQCCSKNDFVPF